MTGAQVANRNIRRTGIPATKRGRPRKINVIRDSNGKSRGEIVDFSVVMNQPHRRDAKGDARKSELLGYPLGRLRTSGEVSENQLRAGNEWAEMVRSYAGMMGVPIGSPRSGSLLSDASKPAYAFSGDEARSDAEEYVKRCASLRAKYDACFNRLCEVGNSIGRGRCVLITMRRICVEEHYPTVAEIGDLRVGLNAIACELNIS